MTHDEDWAACAASVDPGLIEAASAELAADLAPACHRRDLRANGLFYLRGLLMPQVAGNCWPIPEAAGLDRPRRLHHLPDRACWDEDAARDAVRAFLTRHHGGVLTSGETGQVKKGAVTAAAGRHHEALAAAGVRLGVAGIDADSGVVGVQGVMEAVQALQRIAPAGLHPGVCRVQARRRVACVEGIVESAQALQGDAAVGMGPRVCRVEADRGVEGLQ